MLHVESDFGKSVTLSGVYTNNFFTPFTVTVYVGPEPTVVNGVRQLSESPNHWASVL